MFLFGGEKSVKAATASPRHLQGACDLNHYGRRLARSRFPNNLKRPRGAGATGLIHPVRTLTAQSLNAFCWLARQVKDWFVHPKGHRGKQTTP